MPSRIKYFFVKKTPFGILLKTLKKAKIPGFEGLSLFTVAQFFFKGIQEGYITTRASAIAFNFFMALFPATIFIFSLIPYIPIDHFQENLLNYINTFLPENTFKSIEETINDLILRKRSSLLSFGFLLTLYFSTNGINAIISAFNMSYHSPLIGTRSWISQQITSIWLTLVLIIFLITGIGLTAFGGNIIDYLSSEFTSLDKVEILLIGTAKWIIIIGFIYFSVSLLYYSGPRNTEHWKFFSAGSSTATLFIILFSLGFGTYVNNFDSYNKLYGSIGTLMVIMFWLYLNCIALLIGYEMNAAFKGAKNRYLTIKK